MSVLRHGSAEFSSGSQRSRRVVRSPSERQKRVIAVGPPSSRSSRFAAPLSLCETVAAHSSPTVRPAATFSAVFVTGL